VIFHPSKDIVATEWRNPAKIIHKPPAVNAGNPMPAPALYPRALQRFRNADRDLSWLEKSNVDVVKDASDDSVT
jgi:hypothetical protein